MIDNFELTDSNAQLILKLSEASRIKPGDLINFLISQGTQLCLASADMAANLNDLRPILLAHPHSAHICNVLWDGYANGLREQADRKMGILKPD